ncbi:hypothetical protein BN1221_03912 [Brenneria goodwinii]|uniref:Uncharacterized protein n=1 Tax=Brenneria goodwinii TaxID=1109412 RepID=A0A0G4JZW3_9GAMM|nr:hypothetical protein BN1221_03912 [Brenneria goodwinii]
MFFEYKALLRQATNLSSHIDHLFHQNDVKSDSRADKALAMAMADRAGR